MSKIPTNEIRPYFAYASNLLLAQIQIRCPDYKVLGTASLGNYRVVCNKKASNGFDFYAGIIKSPGEEVFGALYQLTANDLARLDKSEGCYDGTAHYYRDENAFYVKDRSTGELVNAFTYFVAKPVTPQKPTTEYAKKIFQGCRDHRLPKAYEDKLRRWFLMEPETP